ncbi:hypothetical protein [Maribellus mangrovi]|uniref:hypothetical protein n=1 Tax=Maribellus mangrovi TaxID=3133146 RepID=UPI0030EF4F33
MKSEKEKIKCLRCKSLKLWEDVDERTGEGFVMCLDCGCNFTLKWKQDENGYYILKDTSKGISPENVLIEKTDIKYPYGICITRISKGQYEFGVLQESNDSDFLRQYINDIMIYDDKTEIKVNRYINGKIKSEYFLRNDWKK